MKFNPYDDYFIAGNSRGSPLSRWQRTQATSPGRSPKYFTRNADKSIS